MKTPHATPSPVLEREILAWANPIREKRGLERRDRIPPGRRGSGSKCPLANLLGPGALVSRSGAVVPTGPGPVGPTRYSALSTPALCFLINFDHGRYPTLIDPT